MHFHYLGIQWSQQCDTPSWSSADTGQNGRSQVLTIANSYKPITTILSRKFIKQYYHVFGRQNRQRRSKTAEQDFDM